MVILWDGLKSLVAALSALFLCGIPAAAGVYALQGWPLPGWAVIPVWAACLLLAGVGLILIAAFLRKAWRGISPARDRRR